MCSADEQLLVECCAVGLWEGYEVLGFRLCVGLCVKCAPVSGTAIFLFELGTKSFFWAFFEEQYRSDHYRSCGKNEFEETMNRLRGDNIQKTKEFFVGTNLYKFVSSLKATLTGLD